MKSVLSLWTLYTFHIILYLENVWSQVKSFNTLPHEITRATAFVPQVLCKSCLLNPDVGPCRSNIRMYYFDPLAKNCSTFNWGGCMGNGNRFDTEEECLDRCVSKPGFRKPKPKWCTLRFDYGFCFGAIERWYYDSTWKVCKKTIYSGCGGNKNNFYNSYECEEICRFGHERGVKLGEDGRAKKHIILNPPNTTPKRGRNQITESTKNGTRVT